MMTGRYTSPRWKSLRDEMIAKARYRCQICDRRGRLEVHHVKHVRDRPDLEFSRENLRVLCFECHREQHRRRSRPASGREGWLVLLQEMGVEVDARAA